MYVQCSHLNGTRSVPRLSPARGRSITPIHHRWTLTKHSELKFRCQAAKTNGKVTIQTPDGNELHIDKDFFSIGSAGGSDLLISGKQVAEEHACIEVKAGRLYCSALVGDPDNFMDATYTWLNDSELRPGCSYLLTPGASLAFGEPSQHYALQYEEKSGPDPVGDMLMKGMLSQASPEVQKQMQEG